MPDARLVTFGDAIVTAIQSGWDPENLPAVVQRRWYSREHEVNFERVVGRKVWVFLGDYRDEPLTRGRDSAEYDVTIETVERYVADPPGEVPDAWVDDRVLWVQDEIWDKLSNPRSDVVLAGYVPAAGQVTPVVSEEMLSLNKVFWSRVGLTFRVNQSA